MIQSRQFKQSIIFIATTLILSGCLLGPKYETPLVESPDNYMQNNDSLRKVKFLDSSYNDTLSLKWWELFGDPVLDSLIFLALENNRDLKATLSSIEQARINIGYNRVNMLPQISYNGNFTQGNFNFQPMPEVGSNSFITGNINWEIDLFGKYKSLTKAAESNFYSQQYNLRAIQITLISEVATNYFLLMDYEERLNVSKQTLKSRDSMLSIIQSRFDYGIIPEIDVNQAKIQREIAAVSVPLYKRLIATTKNNLSVLVGSLPTEIDTPISIIDKTLSDIPVGIPSSILKTRPDLLKIEMDIMSQNYMISNAIAHQFPTISLTGALGFASSSLSALNGFSWNAGGSLFGPIFNFGKNRKRKKIEIEKTKQIVYIYEQATLNAFREVENQLISINTYNEELNAVYKFKEAAVEAEKLSENRYDKGVTSYLEVLQTQKSSLDAQLQYSQTKQLLLNSYVLLYKVLGGGYLTPEEEQEMQEINSENYIQEEKKKR